jgi:hypothetical protein
MTRRKKLTRSQKKAVWSTTKTNAGAGWHGWDAKWHRREFINEDYAPVDPRAFEAKGKHQ